MHRLKHLITQAGVNKGKRISFLHENMTKPSREKFETKPCQVEDIPVVKTNTEFHSDRIKSAIAKGKQIILPCDTKGQNLSKFEHNGRNGPLMVFAQEALYGYNKFGHYKVITSLKPIQSVRNQLFFANGSVNEKKQVLNMTEKSHFPEKCDSAGRNEIEPAERLADKKGIQREKKTRRPTINPDSFEKLIERYKSRRVMYKDLMCAGHVEVLDKLDGLYRQRKQERLKLQAQFSNLGEIRTEINASTGLRDDITDLEEVGREAKDHIKLPKIRVSTVADLNRQESRRKLERGYLAVPKEKRSGTLKLDKLGLQPDVDSSCKRNETKDYETIIVRLPKLYVD